MMSTHQNQQKETGGPWMSRKELCVLLSEWSSSSIGKQPSRRSFPACATAPRSLISSPNLSAGNWNHSSRELLSQPVSATDPRTTYVKSKSRKKENSKPKTLNFDPQRGAPIPSPITGRLNPENPHCQTKTLSRYISTLKRGRTPRRPLIVGRWGQSIPCCPVRKSLVTSAALI